VITRLLKFAGMQETQIKANIHRPAKNLSSTRGQSTCLVASSGSQIVLLNITTADTDHGKNSRKSTTDKQRVTTSKTEQILPRVFQSNARCKLLTNVGCEQMTPQEVSKFINIVVYNNVRFHKL